MSGEEQAKRHPPSWLDKEFIQRALRAGDEDPTITITSYEVKMANAVGDGYASDIYRIIAETQNSHERRMVIKCHPQGGQIEEAVRNLGAFEKETGMLAEALPAMYKCLDKARPGEYPPFAAKCLYHGKDPIEFIVVEDLRQSGFTLAKRQLGLDLAHCTLVVRTLGRYHASSLALCDIDPGFISRYNKPAIGEEMRQQMGQFIRNAIGNLANEVSKWPGYEKYVPKLNNMTESGFDLVLQVCRRRDDELNALSHGDSWSSNMMFKYSDDIPQDMRLVDFQLSCFCSPALDLQYFLNASSNIDVLMNHMDNLLHEYHTSFTDTLDVLGCPKYKISLPQLHKMFKDYSFFGFYAASCVRPIVLTDPENSFDVEAALGEDSVSNDRNQRMYSNEVYVQGMKYLLPLFYKDGVLG